VHSTTVGCLTQPALHLLSRNVERPVEVRGAGLASDDWSTGSARYLDMLAAVVLAPIGLVVQFDVSPDDLVVIPFDPEELVGDVLPEVGGHLDVAPANDNIHANDSSAHSSSTRSSALTHTSTGRQ
jgi:hypothetical protein